MSRSSKGFLLSDVGGVKECLQYVCRTNSARLVAILVNGQAWSKFSHFSACWSGPGLIRDLVRACARNSNRPRRTET